MKMFKWQIELKGDYELEVGYGHFIVYNSKGNQIYFENSECYRSRSEYDDKGNCTYYENSNDFWFKREFDSNNNLIYYEDSEGIIKDDRPKKIIEVTMSELEDKYGCKVKVINNVEKTI